MLEVLDLALQDEETALHFARNGGHLLLLDLLEHESEEIAELAAMVVSSCHPKSGFPRRRAMHSDFQPPHIYHFAAPGSSRGFEVLVRPVLERMSGQVDTGYRMWGAAVILSRWLVMNSSTIFSPDKAVMELGCGLGLPGLTATYLTSSPIILTDYNGHVLENLSYNLRLNGCCSESETQGEREPLRRVRSPDKLAPARPLSQEVTAVMLDWERLDEFVLPCDGVRVILGSDMICQEADARGVVATLDKLLDDDAIAYFVLPAPRCRYGVDALAPLLQKRGFRFSRQAVQELPEQEYLLKGVEGAGELEFELYIIQKASTSAAVA